MNWKTLTAACLLAALNLGALPAMADAKAETYTYGSHLDIQKVVSLTEDSSETCGVVNARMTYLDSHGDRHVLGYSKLAENCSDGS